MTTETYPAIRRTLAALAAADRPRSYIPVHVAELRQLMDERDRLAAGPDRFLIWSNQKGMWWRPAEAGYTQVVHEAGMYARADAERIHAKATCEGRLVHIGVDPVTGMAYRYLDEVLVPAFTLPILTTVLDGDGETTQDAWTAS